MPCGLGHGQTWIMQPSFFDALAQLTVSAPLRIDRARGSAHPRFPRAIYPVDSGFLEGTSAADGEGVDVFRGSNTGGGICAAALTVDAAKRDVEIKVLFECTATEVDDVAAFLSDTLGLGTMIVRP